MLITLHWFSLTSQNRKISRKRKVSDRFFYCSSFPGSRAKMQREKTRRTTRWGGGGGEVEEIKHLKGCQECDKLI
jgi:hypothetical protein